MTDLTSVQVPAFLLSSEITGMGYGSMSCLRLSVAVVKLSDTDEVRNYLDSSWPREPLADLQVHAQLDDSPSGQGVPYGWRVEFARPFSVDLQRAEEMVKVLRKVQRGLAKLEEEFGYPESFGAYVARVAKVLGVKRFGWRTSIGGRSSSVGFYDDNAYRWTDASGMGAHLNSVCAEFLKPAQQVPAS